MDYIHNLAPKVLMILIFKGGEAHFKANPEK